MSDATLTAESEAPADTMHGDDLNVGAIALWGLVSVVITAISILALHAFFNAYSDQQRAEKSYAQAYKSAEDELNNQNGALVEAVRWLDNEQTKVGVPIDRAMTIVVKQYSKEKE